MTVSTAAKALAEPFPGGGSVDHLRPASNGTAAPAGQVLAEAVDVERGAIAARGASGCGAAFLGPRAGGLTGESLLVELGLQRTRRWFAPTSQPQLVTAIGEPASETGSSPCALAGADGMSWLHAQKQTREGLRPQTGWCIT